MGMNTVKAWALAHENGKIADVALTLRHIETKLRILRYEIPSFTAKVVRVEIRALKAPKGRGK